MVSLMSPLFELQGDLSQFLVTDDSDKLLYNFDPSTESINSLLTIDSCIRELLELNNEESKKEVDHTETRDDDKDVRVTKAKDKSRDSEKNKTSLKSIKKRRSRQLSERVNKRGLFYQLMVNRVIGNQFIIGNF